MKSKLPLIITITISLALLILTYIFWPQVHTLLLPNVDNGFYITNPLEKTLAHHWLFSLATGLMPLIVYFIWKYTPVNGKRKKMIALLIILVCVTVAIIFHRYQVARMLNNTGNPALQTGIPFSQVQFEKYLLSGFLAGAVIPWFLLREKKYLSHGS